eukprot:4638646-Pleurochrysis_carterae.AAC.4
MKSLPRGCRPSAHTFIKPWCQTNIDIKYYGKIVVELLARFASVSGPEALAASDTYSHNSFGSFSEGLQRRATRYLERRATSQNSSPPQCLTYVPRLLFCRLYTFRYARRMVACKPLCANPKDPCPLSTGAISGLLVSSEGKVHIVLSKIDQACFGPLGAVNELRNQLC